MSENTETNPTQPVTPVPEVTVPPQVPVTPVVEAAPIDSTIENKNVAAFVKMRKTDKANKIKIAELEAKLASAQQQTPPIVVAPVAQTVETVTPAPAPVAEVVDSEEVAIQELAKDADVMSVPGGIIDIMDLVDSDPKLVKLNAIDSKLAFTEAKKLWAAKLGIGTTPQSPAPTQISGGMSSGSKDLMELFKAVDSAKPGSKAYREAVKAVNEAMSQQ